MNLGFRKIFTVLAGFLLAINMPAQDLPLLPEDPAVLKGVMPNGMAYYLVTNPDEKGIADFALVQKTGLLNSDDGRRVTAAADATVSSLKRVKNPRKDISVNVTDDATTLIFNDVHLFEGVNAVDSTLLLIMDIADKANYIDDEFIKRWYSPADQAVIVSGDIDSKAVASKLIYMSYMMPARESMPRREHKKDEKKDILEVKGKNGMAEISATWTSERVPREYMNTVQPEIFEMSLNTLGEAAADRIKSCLKSMDIPVADVSYSHVCSSTYPYDDSFSIHVAVGKENAGKARDAVAYVMSSIDGEGVATDEYVTAESSYIQGLVEAADRPVRSNHEYVERCRNAFLYNASLASPKERLDFHASRDLPDTMRRRLFNGIASALIDTAGIHASGQMDHRYVDVAVHDTLTKPVMPMKIKVRSSKKEPVSGGETWTFPNGFKVIYKKMASDRMYYSLALNGGYGSIEGLDSGEGAFIADYLKTCRIADMRAEDFIKYLRREGIIMDVAVSLSNMKLSGSLPDDKMPLLLRSLLAVANERTQGGEDEFDYYQRSEYLALEYAQGGFASRMTAVDSIMCPGYKYSPYKTKGKISSGFAEKAEKFYDTEFGKTNDGVLVLVGNMDKDVLKKQLLAYVGHFRTANTVSRKPIVRYQAVSGSSTYIVEGDSDNVDIAISARMPLSIDNYAAANLALMILRRDLVGKFNELGMDVAFAQNCRIYPEERLNLVISIPSASLENLSAVRSVLAGMKSIEISDEELKAYKEAVKHNMALDRKKPAYWVHAIVLRYIDGKDLSTNYAAKVDAVTAENVREVLSLLDGGTKVEYVTIKK